MALQIIVTSLIPDFNLTALCRTIFPAFEHLPRTERNPYEVYVFKTAAGTEIEAMAHANNLSFEFHGHDLNDTTFGAVLFEIATRGACAISSDDAEFVVVTDEKHAVTAVDALGVPSDQIEVTTSGPEILEILFGIEPPRTASPELAAGLTARGFHIDATNFHRATLRTSNGNLLELDPDEHFGWQETSGVSLGFSNPRFAKIMDGWTSDLSGPLGRLDARKHRQDTAGFILWSGQLRFEQSPVTIETSVLGLHDKTIPFHDLIEKIVDPPSATAMVQQTFGGELEPFVMPTEGLWVFLFLMAEATMCKAEIFDSYNKLKSSGAAFGSSGSLNSDIVDAYLELHQDRLGS